MIRDSIRYGWSKARSLVWTFLPVTLLSLAQSFLPSWNIRSNGTWTLYFWWFDMGPPKQLIGTAITILHVAVLIISIWAATGVIDCSVKIARGESVTARDFFGMWKSVWRYIVGCLLCGLIVGLAGTLIMIPVGFLMSSAIHLESSVLFYATTGSLCILACLAILGWATRYTMFGYYIVTQEAGPVEALRMSVKVTAGHRRELLGFLLASTGIEILGILCLGVGTLWAMPTVSIAGGAVFLKLVGQDTAPENQDLTEAEDSLPNGVPD